VIFLEKTIQYDPKNCLEHVGIVCLSLKINLRTLGLNFRPLEVLSRSVNHSLNSFQKLFLMNNMCEIHLIDPRLEKTLNLDRIWIGPHCGLNTCDSSSGSCNLIKNLMHTNA
jgi:hypothetical protein